MRGPMMLGVVAALVVVGAVGVSGGVPPRHNELAGYTFGRYMEDFGKGYERGTAEYARRERLFLREVEAVRRHNAGGRATYKKGVNRYSDWTVEEKRRLRGVVGVGGARGAMGVGAGVPMHAAVGAGPLPRSVDYRTAQPAVLTAVKDQGICGSCWAHAVTQSVETYSGDGDGRGCRCLSQQQVTACTPPPSSGLSEACNGSDGATAELGVPSTVTQAQRAVCWRSGSTRMMSYAGWTWVVRASRRGCVIRRRLGNCVRRHRRLWRGTMAVSRRTTPRRCKRCCRACRAGVGGCWMPHDWMNYESGVYDGMFELEWACRWTTRCRLVGYGVDNGHGAAVLADPQLVVGEVGRGGLHSPCAVPSG